MHKRPKITDDSQAITDQHTIKPVLPSQESIDHRTEMEKINKEWFKYMKKMTCLDCCCTTLCNALLYFSTLDRISQ